VKVGFIGLGHMGKPMAANVLKAGFELTIHDVRPEVRYDPLLAGAQWAATPRDAAAASEVLITSLPGPEQVDAVIFGPEGALSGMRDGTFYIDMSTSTPGQARQVASAAAPLGVGVIDAPVAGGVRGARNGTLTIMAGGSQRAFDACLPVLRAMGEQIFLVGDVGSGHVAKLVNNMMTIINGLTAMEAMVVGAKAGLDVERLLEVVEAGTGSSFSLNVIRYVIFRGNFDPAKFALSLAAKDLRLAVEYASELGVEMNIVPHASEALAAAAQRGLADRDWSSYITLIEDSAGVEVRA
jgi:3-hydroxyisobutyrate dehydrogenase-like beta-hydroxyacid dehydrogenase